MSYGFDFGTLGSLAGAIKGATADMVNIQSNLENFRTPGFKQEVLEFSAAFTDAKGRNAPGVRLISMGRDFSQGALSSGTPLDAAISGKGLFVMKSEFSNFDVYTRASNWVFDSNGFLVDAYRRRVKGFDFKNGAVDKSSLGSIQIDLDQYSVEDVGFVDNGLLIGNYREVTQAQEAFENGDDTVIVPELDVLAQLAVAYVPNPSQLKTQVGTAYSATRESGVPQVGVSGDSKLGLVSGSSFESSTVSPALESVKAIDNQRYLQMLTSITQKNYGIINTIMTDVVGKA